MKVNKWSSTSNWSKGEPPQKKSMNANRKTSSIGAHRVKEENPESSTTDRLRARIDTRPRGQILSIRPIQREIVKIEWIDEDESSDLPDSTQDPLINAQNETASIVNQLKQKLWPK